MEVLYTNYLDSTTFRCLALAFVGLFYMVCYVFLNFKLIGKNPGTMTSEVDKAIPFVPYYSLYYTFTYVYLAGGTMWVLHDVSNQDFINTINTFMGIVIVSVVTYLIYPVQSPRPKVTKEQMKDIFVRKVMAIYHYLDPYNLFPSMHTGFSMVTLLLAIEFKPELVIIFYPMTVGILLSTVFIKQHYLPDVFAGYFLSQMIFQYFF